MTENKLHGPRSAKSQQRTIRSNSQSPRIMLKSLHTVGYSAVECLRDSNTRWHHSS